MKIFWPLTSRSLSDLEFDHSIACLKALLAGSSNVTVIPCAVTAEPAQELTRLKVKFAGVELPALISPETLEASATRSPQEQIAQFCESQAVDLVFLTNRGVGSVSRTLLGSFTENLLRHLRTPIFAVNAKSSPAEIPRTLTYATDFSERSWIAFEKLLLLARATHREVRLVHIEEPGERGPAIPAGEWLAKASQAGVPCEVEWIAPPSADLVKALSEISAKKGGPSFLALTTHGSNWKEDGAPSVARQLLREASFPLMIFHV